MLRAAPTVAVLLCAAFLPTAVVTKSGGGGMNVAQAIQQSKKTGRPIFAVAGASYCPACKQLLNTLNTEQSLRPFLNQFVPLKIDAQSDDYQRWKKFFPPKRAAIPALYIVSSQGEQLYGAVGSLPEKSLKKVMLASLEKAGRYPSDDDWAKIGTTLKSAELALTEQKHAAAIALLEPLLANLETVGELAALSEPGQKASEQLQQFADQQRSALDAALGEFARRADFETALQVATSEQICEMFPSMRGEVKLAVKKAVRKPDERKLLRQASELSQAESLGTDDEKSRRKAERALERIAKRYPQTEAAARAERKLAQLSGANR